MFIVEMQGNNFTDKFSVENGEWLLIKKSHA